jgi:hypothetical protein
MLKLNSGLWLLVARLWSLAAGFWLPASDHCFMNKWRLIDNQVGTKYQKDIGKGRFNQSLNTLHKHSHLLTYLRKYLI